MNQQLKLHGAGEDLRKNAPCPECGSRNGRYRPWQHNTICKDCGNVYAKPDATLSFPKEIEKPVSPPHQKSKLCCVTQHKYNSTLAERERERECTGNNRVA